MSLAQLQEAGSELPRHARLAIEAWARGGSLPASVSLLEARPVFVTLRTLDGELRGCIGRLEPETGDLYREVAVNAVSAASRDPRFPPVSERELPGLSVEVSVLSPPEQVRDLGDLDPALYGVIVDDLGGHRGVLLPGIPGIDDPRRQVAVAAGKAGLRGEDLDHLRVQRFVVSKFREPGR